MRTEKMEIHSIPAVLYGEPSETVWLFLQGQGGCKEEAGQFAEVAVPAGDQVLGIDLPEHGARRDVPGFYPWVIVPELQAVLEWMQPRWKTISLRANSIGAYFSMLALADRTIEKALFVSPVVKMEKLMLDMMNWAGVTEEQLRLKGEIPTSFGQTLSWNYLSWVREHPVSDWKTPTAVLFAGKDHPTSRETMGNFVKDCRAVLTVYEAGEHWFHTPEQLAELRKWEQKNLAC